MAGPKIQMLVSEGLEFKKKNKKLNHKQFWQNQNYLTQI